MKFTTVQNPINFTTEQSTQFKALADKILSAVSESVDVFVPSQALDGKTPNEDVLFMQFIVSDADFETVTDIVDDYFVTPQVFSFSVVTREDFDDTKAGVCFDLGTSY